MCENIIAKGVGACIARPLFVGILNLLSKALLVRTTNGRPYKMLFIKFIYNNKK